ncbi:Ferric reduction oxidase 2 [Nymphaea thermarum]|nr:Ferric reduction oxidase 2 [Nymphaea thermarum]
MIVKGPLGTLSTAELAFTLMFVALLIWLFSTFLAVGLPKTTVQDAHKFDLELWQLKLWKVSVWLAFVGVLCTALLFIPVSRGSAILKVAGLSFEESIRYHIWLGHTAMAVFTIHGLFYVIIWASNNNLHEMLVWTRVGTSNVAGELSWLFGLGLWVTTLPYIRRKMFELFFYTHQLYVLFVFFYVLHVGASHFYMFLPGLYLFMVDRFLRFLQSRQPVRLLCARVLPCHVVELTFSKRLGLHYNPMSTVFINIPTISTLQWHPFSVTSDNSLEKDELTVVIKSEGGWSEALYQKLSSKNVAVDRLEVAVEGPYGPPSIDYLRHDVLVMISGGVGITPFFSIVRHLLAQRTKAPRLLLVCAFKSSAELHMLDLLLPVSLSATKISSLELQVEAYVTREKEPQIAQTEAQTIWFKPSQSDAPLSWAVGSNCNWLWRGAVIVASFSLFLVIFGVFTRFFTYPMESKSQSHYKYPTWLRAFFMMFFMFMSIVLVSTVATISIRRKEAKEGGQIQNLEMQTPTGTPGQLTYKAERELESFPHQSVVQSTNVQYTYGARPDFKKILAQFQGESDVGVMVCGPKEMKEDVAGICSPANANNLHFHCVSFDF